jgi:iron-sulfur cluster assembly protein
MITLTTAATKQITRYLAKRGKGAGIRIGVKTTGCSGLAYVLEYIDKYEADVGVINFAQDKFAVIVDKNDLPYLNGMIIDFVRQGLNEGFEFKNPNERDRCGCGESFRI